MKNVLGISAVPLAVYFYSLSQTVVKQDTFLTRYMHMYLLNNLFASEPNSCDQCWLVCKITDMTNIELILSNFLRSVRILNNT